MGLFENMLGNTTNEQIMLSSAESFGGIVLAVISSDGYISDEEIESVNAILTRMKLYNNWERGNFSNMWNKLLGVQKRNGNESLLKNSCELLPKELRETAFTIAVDLVLADGSIAENEKKFLNDLQALLNIEDNLAVKIFEVIMIKNKG